MGLAAGQIGVLIGPSGCGKTTLLRAVAGLEPLAAGRIRMDGRGAGRCLGRRAGAARNRRIGMVFQDYALFPHLSVADNVAFGVQELPRAERAARVQQMLDLVGLSHAANRAPHQLSGGQQQRIALARALAPAPRLLLLDEPFSNLDVDLRERLAHEVRGILKEPAPPPCSSPTTSSRPLRWATYRRHECGRLEQWDDAYALYHRPATRFVAQFIGHGVFTPARIDGPRPATPVAACIPCWAP